MQVAVAVLGEPRLRHNGDEIDLTPPWPRKTLREAIRQATRGSTTWCSRSRRRLLKAAQAAGADIESDTVWPRIVDELLKQFVRPYLIQPTFLIDYPVALSPLAKRKPDDPTHVERFQPYIGGGELGNAFTELNDPLDQLARFVEQQRGQRGWRRRGDADRRRLRQCADVRHAPDGRRWHRHRPADHVADRPATLRDVILFPAMRKLSTQSASAEEATEED